MATSAGTAVSFVAETTLPDPMATETHKGASPAETLVGMKPVVEGIGLNWERQREKLAAHPVLAPTIRGVPFPSAGGVQDTLCIPLSKLNFWLATIQPNKVPHLRAKASRKS